MTPRRPRRASGFYDNVASEVLHHLELIRATPMPKVVNAHGRKPNDVGAKEVYVGRNTRNGWRKSKWANPYHIPKDGNRDEVVEKFEHYILGNPELLAALPELRGQDLVCWCAPERCHADVLLELANRSEAAE